MASALAYWRWPNYTIGKGKDKKPIEGYEEKYRKNPAKYFKSEEAPYGHNLKEEGKYFWDQLEKNKDRLYQISIKRVDGKQKIVIVCTFIVRGKNIKPNDLHGRYEIVGHENDAETQFIFPENDEVDITDLLIKYKIIPEQPPKNPAGYGCSFQGQPRRKMILTNDIVDEIEERLLPYRKKDYRDKYKPTVIQTDNISDWMTRNIGITPDQIEMGRKGEEWFIKKMDKGGLKIQCGDSESILKKPKQGKFDVRNDGIGYDFNCVKDGGNNILLEIKTFSRSNGRVFLTRNEMNKAMSHSSEYWLLGLKKMESNAEFIPQLSSAKDIKKNDWEPMTYVCRAGIIFGK